MEDKERGCRFGIGKVLLTYEFINTSNSGQAKGKAVMWASNRCASVSPFLWTKASLLLC